MILDECSWLVFLVSQLCCTAQHGLPQYLDVYFQLRQTCLAQTVGNWRTLNSKDIVMWTLESRHHRHFQKLGSLSKYSQRHREQEFAYNVKKIGLWVKMPNNFTAHRLKQQKRWKGAAYTKVTAFLVRTHFLFMNIKMPMIAQTRQRLPTRQMIISGGSTGIDTSSLQRSPW